MGANEGEEGFSLHPGILYTFRATGGGGGRQAERTNPSMFRATEVVAGRENPSVFRAMEVVGGRENPSTHISSDRGERWLVVSYHSIKRKKVCIPLYAQKPLKTSIPAHFEGCGGGG